MGVEIVKRFYCSRCDYSTENTEQIKQIEKLGGKCPACGNGELRTWGKDTTDKERK